MEIGHDFFWLQVVSGNVTFLYAIKNAAWYLLEYVAFLYAFETKSFTQFI